MDREDRQAKYYGVRLIVDRMMLKRSKAAWVGLECFEKVKKEGTYTAQPREEKRWWNNGMPDAWPASTQPALSLQIYVDLLALV